MGSTFILAENIFAEPRAIWTPNVHIHSNPANTYKGLVTKFERRTFLIPSSSHLPFTNSLYNLSESTVKWRSNWLDVLPEVNGSLSTLGNTLWGEFELLVDILVWARSTESVET